MAARKRSRVPAKAVSREQEVLDAAATTFMDLGFSAASIDSIGDAMGVTKGVIYYYFKSKNDLFFAVQKKSMEFTRDAIEPIALRADTPARKLHAMAHAHVMLIFARLAYLRVAAQGVELHLLGRTTLADRIALDEILKLREQNEKLYVGVLKEGVATGDFRSLEPPIAVKPLLGALNWTSRWYQPRSNETRAGRDRLAHEIADFVLGGVLAHRAPDEPAARAARSRRPRA